MINEPIYGCAGCQNTAGAGGCPVHGQYHSETLKLERRSPMEAITEASLRATLAEKKVRELELQVSELQKNVGHHNDLLTAAVCERDVALRLFESLKKYAGHINPCNYVTNEEPFECTCGLDAIRGTGPEKKCEENHTISCPGDSICQKCGAKKRPDWGQTEKR